MNQSHKIISQVLATLLTTASFAGLVTANEEIVSYPKSTLEWIEIPDTGGIKYANVRGDLAGKGAYEAFVIFPANKHNPYHYHSEAIPTVVMQGTFYAVVEGVRTEYPAGSFYDLPGKLKHFSGCAEGADCLLFQYQDGPFDLVPRDEP